MQLSEPVWVTLEDESSERVEEGVTDSLGEPDMLPLKLGESVTE